MTAVTFELELEPELEEGLQAMAEEANLPFDEFVNNLFREHFADYLAHRKYLEENNEHTNITI